MAQDKDFHEARQDFDTPHSTREREVVGYGAGRKSSGTYAAIFFGAVIAVGAILYMIGWSGTRTFEQANNPAAKIEGERAVVPGAGTTGQGSPGGNWDTRLNQPEQKK